MSYCRFGEGSDVYVFASDVGLECCGCLLQDQEWVEDERALFGGYLKDIGEIIPHVFQSNHEMIEHLEKHVAAGHAVPDRAFARLRDPVDAEENLRWWAAHRRSSS